MSEIQTPLYSIASYTGVRISDTLIFYCELFGVEMSEIQTPLYITRNCLSRAVAFSADISWFTYFTTFCGKQILPANLKAMPADEASRAAIFTYLAYKKQLVATTGHHHQI